jgi:hypothetical protein
MQGAAAHTACYPPRQMPKYLLERWAQVTQAQIPLATIRRYPNDRFFLVVPRDPPPPPPAPGAPPLATEDTHDVFELDVVAREPQNAYVVAQRPKPGADVRSRARDTALHGRVGVEMNARPRLSADYEARVRARLVVRAQPRTRPRAPSSAWTRTPSAARAS